MKKRYLILAGILAASMLAAGCGKKNSVAPEQKVEATATPTVTEAAKTDVVEMQTSTDETANIKNVMGTKSETTTSIVFTNKMNSTISAIYVRPTRDDGDDSDETWGSDLVNGKFTLASNDKAVYYMEKSQKDDNGDTATSFDVRITFSDEDQNECFFRQLPLLTISQLSLCMDGEGEDGIPYATYLASGNTKEVSTLKDVKARLGIEDESDSDSTDSSDSTVVTPTPKNSDNNGGSTDSIPSCKVDLAPLYEKPRRKSTVTLEEAKELYPDCIAVAHHKEDQAETFLFRLIRGSSARGLAAMLPKRDFIIRPLLFAEKGDILAFLEEKKIPWREDITNQDTAYQRNWIRKELLPLLKENLNPGAVRHIADAADDIGKWRKYIREQAECEAEHVIFHEGKEVLLRRDVCRGR